MEKDFSGVFTALVTPFDNDRVDLRSFERVIEHQLKNGISGFVVNGTTGESPTLSIEEVKSLFETCRKVSGDVPIILGTGSNSTAKTIAMTKMAEDWGADAALVVTPYYSKPPQRGLVSHFRKVAESVNMPIMLYNVPGRTIVDISILSLCELSKIKNIVGLKEASGDLMFFEEAYRELPKDFVLTSGDDQTCVEAALKGGQGVISVISHVIPSELSGFIDQARNKDKSAASRYKDTHSELLEWVYSESNPIGVKMALYQMGLIASPELRLPMVALNEESSQGLRECLKTSNILGDGDKK